jgi:hypothetical protein
VCHGGIVRQTVCHSPAICRRTAGAGRNVENLWMIRAKPVENPPLKIFFAPIVARTVTSAVVGPAFARTFA